MKSSVEQVREFHEVFDLARSEVPCNYTLSATEKYYVTVEVQGLKLQEKILKSEAAYTNSNALLRMRLIVSELREVFEAVLEGDLEKILHEATDLQYVVDGLFVELGLDKVKSAAGTRVHTANLSKLVDGKAIRDESGKVQKGPNFKPATMEGLV